jgi:predicted solute-binding protein
MTGLPFVFAVWVSLNYIEQLLVQKLNQSFDEGIKNFDSLNEVRFEFYNVQRYITSNLSFNFDTHKKNGLRKFIEIIF